MARSLQITVALSVLLMLVLLGFVPQTQAYTFVAHSVCKGWTEAKEPIKAERFLVDDSVYLYFHIDWEYAGECETDSVNFRVALIDPKGSEVKIGPPFRYYHVRFEEGCLTSGFLHVLNVTETTKNGGWRVDWYDGDKLLFSEEFTVGSASPSPSPSPTATSSFSPSPSPTSSPAPVERTFGEQYGLWIVAVVAIVIVAVLVIMASKRRKRPPYAPAPSPKATLLRYCTECGSQIPASDAFCNRCGAKQ